MSDASVASSIRRCQFFAGVRESEILVLAAHSRKVHYEKGQVIIAQATVARGYFLILQGTARVLMQDQQGREFIICKLKAGSGIGEISCLDNGLEWASVVAHTDVSALCIQREVVNGMLPPTDSVGHAFLNAMRDRVREADKKLELMGLNDVPARLKVILREVSTPLSDGRAMIAGQLNNDELGKMVGASREMVRKSILLFKKQELIHEDDLGRTFLSMEMCRTDTV